MKRFAIFIFIALILSFPGCKSNPTTPTPTSSSGESTAEAEGKPEPPPPATATPIPQKPGDWTSTTAFGSFEFNVNSSSPSITSIIFSFSNWHGISGTVISTPSPPWSITNRSFKIEATLIGNQKWTFEGTFEQSGDKASGTWQVVISGQTESGTWQAVPKSYTGNFRSDPESEEGT